LSNLLIHIGAQGTPEEDADCLVYGEIAALDFLAFLDKHGETSAAVAGGGGQGDGWGGGRGAGSERGGGGEGGAGARSVGGRVFWDLGSGTGKAVMAAGLCRHFAHVRGIELLPCTAGIAAVLVEDFARDVLPGARAASNPLRSVAVECGDFFSPHTLHAWAAGDFVFCNCVTWDDATMMRLSAAAEGLRPGAVFVTVLCPLSSDKFEVVDEVELPFSWGSVECVVHRRLTDQAAHLAATLGASMARMGAGGAHGDEGRDVDMDTER
jgi:hypothetical protein